jgi:hypothetical protein
VKLLRGTRTFDFQRNTEVVLPIDFDASTWFEAKGFVDGDVFRGTFQASVEVLNLPGFPMQNQSGRFEMRFSPSY